MGKAQPGSRNWNWRGYGIRWFRKFMDKSKRHTVRERAIAEGLEDYENTRHLEEEVMAEICTPEEPCGWCQASADALARVEEELDECPPPRPKEP